MELVNVNNNKKPRVLVVSQWPKIKNAEFQLISSIKKANCEIVVVDYLGFDVETGENINNPRLHKNFDFAISLHFDTPKLLNITTYNWISNPLEFLYLRSDYKQTLVSNFIGYDDFLFNGSDTLKMHIKNLLGSEWSDNGHEFYPSVAASEIIEPAATHLDKIKKLFYCGVNWEVIVDKKARNENLLLSLSDENVIDIFGPKVIDKVKPWKRFNSYKGEIPFDGMSLRNEMLKYTAVLAVSSPAHIRSRTSSSRVFEGFAAGVPVISDNNHHVKKLFGDLVYYYTGATSQQASDDIRRILDNIISNPEEAKNRVVEAQRLLRDKYSFDVCINNSLQKYLSTYGNKDKAYTGKVGSGNGKKPKFQIFMFHHNPEISISDASFNNIEYCLSAIEHAQLYGADGLIIIVYSCHQDLTSIKNILSKYSVHFKFLSVEQLGVVNWDNVRLGAKIAVMIKYIEADFITFINSNEYLHYDFFTKKLLETHDASTVNIAGGYFADFKEHAPADVSTIKRFNINNDSHVWSNSSFDENQLGRMTFPSSLLTTEYAEKISFFDFLLPIVAVLLAEQYGYDIFRSRYITLRMDRNLFADSVKNFQNCAKKSFWDRHYLALSNFEHEANAGYDIFRHNSKLLNSWTNLHKAETNTIEPRLLSFMNNMFRTVRHIYRVIKGVWQFLSSASYLKIFCLRSL